MYCDSFEAQDLPKLINFYFNYHFIYILNTNKMIIQLLSQSEQLHQTSKLVLIIIGGNYKHLTNSKKSLCILNFT